MTQSNLNIVMVMLGLLLAMSLDTLVYDTLMGSVLLAGCVTLFILFNHLYNKKDEKPADDN